MIRKFFGHGDVFIKSVSNIKLQGETYNSGDTIAYFKGVSISLEYALNHKEATTVGRELSHIQRYPSVLNISGIPNTKELERIFFEEPQEEEVEYSTVEVYPDVKNTIYLREKTSPVKVRMFSNKKEIEIDDYNEEEMKISFQGSYEAVEVVSTFKEVGERRGFDKPKISYVSIHATIKGLKGEDDSIFILEVPKADLVSEPTIDLSDAPNYGTMLSFALINADQNKPTVVQING